MYVEAFRSAVVLKRGLFDDFFLYLTGCDYMRTEDLVFNLIIRILSFLLKSRKSQYWSRVVKNQIFCSCEIFFSFLFVFFHTKPPQASIVDDKSGTNMYDEPT